MHKVVFLTLFAASCSAATIHLENVEEKLRLLNPTFMMVEQLLNLQDKSQCIERMFCLLETEMARNDTNPLKHYARFLTNVYEEVEPATFATVKSLVAKYRHISKLINAIEVGKMAGQSEQCDKMYEGCPKEQSQLVWFAKMTGDDVISNYLTHQPAKSKRSDCEGSALACSLVGGGCALCNAMTEGVCGLLCESDGLGNCAGAISGCISD